jgi:hypothetical protein
MYATCLFCNKPLGSNETFETFPVGKRLAFDAAKGRLWVVCPHCERWNLTPLEDRWEAIESAEKLFRDARQRVSTDNIGLAKLRDGTTLVRIGAPQRPEFAAWRYGDQFGRRRRRQMIIAGAGIGALSALVIGGVTAGVGIGGFGWMLARAGGTIIRGSPDKVVARIRTPSGQTIGVRRRHLLETSIVPGTNAPFAIDLRYINGGARFEGADAMRIASIVVPAANRFGGNKETVAKAVGTIEESGGTEGFLDRISRVAAVTTRTRLRPERSETGSWTLQSAGSSGWGGVQTVWGGVRIGARRNAWGGRWSNGDWSTGLFGLDPVQRLALEMALHEDAERSALEGELSELERAWQEAEEIAGIADNLLLPEGLWGALDRLRGKS